MDGDTGKHSALNSYIKNNSRHYREKISDQRLCGVGKGEMFKAKEKKGIK